MRRLVLVILLLAGCSGDYSGNAPSESVAANVPTDKPEPTPKPTVTPTKNIYTIDLESLLIEPGDLPIGMTESQVIEDLVPGGFKDNPPPDRIIQQRIEDPDSYANVGGSVTVLFYKDRDIVQKSFDITVKGMDKDGVATNKIGEQAWVIVNAVAFTRCNVLAYIVLNKDVDPDSLISFARRLDKRLQEPICFP